MLVIDHKRFPRGSALPSHLIDPKHLQALLEGKPAGARWERFNPSRFYPEPIELPKLEPAKPRPAVHLVEDEDVCEAWRLSREAMVRCCDNNAALAMDLLMGDVAARDLYKRAVHAATAREAKRRGVVSVSPNEVSI
jgi:hypothetical protein